MSDMLRITGLATGIDTESMIQKLMSAQYIKVDRVKQQRQIVEWQRNSYRDISNLLRGFKDEFFDYLNPSTNLRSANSFAAFSTTARAGGVDTNAVTIRATGSASTGTHTLNNIALAKKALWKSSGSVSPSMTGGAVNFADLKEGKSFDITLDGTKRTITLNSSAAGASDAATLAGELQTLINDTFGAGNISVTHDGSNHLVFEAQGHILQLSSTPHTYVSDLGFRNPQTNSITGEILDFSSPISISGNLNIDVNGVKTNVSVDITNAADITDFTVQLQADIDSALGTGVVRVSNYGDRIKLISHNTSDEITVLSGDTTDVIGQIGFSSGAKISKLQGDVNLDMSDIGKEFDIYVEGSKYHIDLPSDYSNLNDLANEINNQLSMQGAGITVSDDGSGNLIFNGTNGSEITVADSTESIVNDLGFKSGDLNIVNFNTTLRDLNLDIPIVFNGGKAEFEINGVSFSFDETDTLQYVMNEVNTSSAGVTFRYSSLSDTFTLQSENEGAINDISLNDLNGTNLLSGVLKLTQEQAATDAQFTLDGVTTTRSSNIFTIDGIEYTLNSDYDPTGTEGLADIELNINADPDEVIDKIKDFVAKYNEVISTINDKISEERYFDYKPLTEAQKDEMSETEIERWEEKAKSGILRSDSMLQSITSDMRRALYDTVEGVGLNLYDIGIKTSSFYQDKGKLVIDEEKLKSALTDNLSEIAQLFTKESDIRYSDSSNRSQRYSEQGLAHRLHDIIEDNIRITRDSDGYKGSLLEKAGIEGDVTEFNNILSEELKDYDDRINDLLKDLADKEDYYYLMFARMEQSISQMNSQSSWLMQQMGGGM